MASLYCRFDDLYKYILNSKISLEEKHEFDGGNGYSKGLASVVEDTVFYELLDEEKKAVLVTFMKIFKEVNEDLRSKGADVQGLKFTPIHADVSFVNASDELDVEAFKNWRSEFKDAIFIGEKGEIIVLL